MLTSLPLYFNVFVQAIRSLRSDRGKTFDISHLAWLRDSGIYCRCRAPGAKQSRQIILQQPICQGIALQAA
jgi:hypothetical protein